MSGSYRKVHFIQALSESEKLRTLIEIYGHFGRVLITLKKPLRNWQGIAEERSGIAVESDKLDL